MTRFEQYRQESPRAFEALASVGWTPARQVEIDPAFERAVSQHGYNLLDHEFADAFLRSFGGLRVKIPSPRGNSWRGFEVASLPDLDRMLTKLDLSATFLFIEELARSPTLYPVMTSGGNVIFVRPDGGTLCLEQTFQGLARAPDPFRLMHWLLFDEAPEGVVVEPIPNEQRPIRFQWR